MANYDQPSRHVYCFPGTVLTGAFTRNIRGPKGRRGRVASASAQVTTSVAGGTTLPVLSVTTTVSPVQASPSGPIPAAQTPVLVWPIPATAAPAGISSDATSNALQRDANYFPYILAADSDNVLALTVLATGAGAAGVADIEIAIDWF